MSKCTLENGCPNCRQIITSNMLSGLNHVLWREHISEARLLEAIQFGDQVLRDAAQAELTRRKPEGSGWQSIFRGGKE